jgi:hypothetical protein
MTVFYRYAIDYKDYGPDTTALGRADGFYDLTADEVGIKLTEILKEHEKIWRMDQEELDEYKKTHNTIELSSIRIRYWGTVGE